MSLRSRCHFPGEANSGRNRRSARLAEDVGERRGHDGLLQAQLQALLIRLSQDALADGVGDGETAGLERDEEALRLALSAPLTA